MHANEYLCGLPLEESITVDYDLARILAVPEFGQRSSFLSRVLGNRRYEVAIDLGAGLGAVSAWAAQRSQYVIGFDLSKTHCLLYTFVMWHQNIHNAYVFHGTLDTFGGTYCPCPVDLIVSYNGLTRHALLEQWPGITKYLQSQGLFLLTYPAFFFTDDDTSPESIALREYGLEQGWDEQALPTPSDLHLEVDGDAGTETDSLPFLSKMSGLFGLFDFESGTPTNAWTGDTRIQLRLEYRLYRKLG